MGLPFPNIFYGDFTRWLFEIDTYMYRFGKRSIEKIGPKFLKPQCHPTKRLRAFSNLPHIYTVCLAFIVYPIISYDPWISRDQVKAAVVIVGEVMNGFMRLLGDEPWHSTVHS